MDRHARHATNRRVDNARQDLVRTATDLQREVTRFVAEMIHGGPFSGRALNIARDAAELAMKAGAYDTATDLASITEPGEGV